MLVGIDRKGREKRTRGISDGVRVEGRKGSLKVLENEGDGGVEAWLWKPGSWKGKYFIIEKLRLNGNVSLFTPRRHIKVRARRRADRGG